MTSVGKTLKLRSITIALTAAFLAAGLSACDDGRAGAQDAAKALVGALSGLDVGKIAWEGKEPAAVNEQVKAVFAALEPQKPTVSAGDLKLDGSTATVPLNYVWQVQGNEWKYSTSARLKKDGDAWRAEWSPNVLLPDLQDSEVLALKTTAAPRGNILGARDEPLVMDRPVLKVGIDKQKVDAASHEASAKALANLVGVDPAEYAAQLKAAGAQAFVPAITLRDDNNRTITDQQIAAIPGAIALKDSLALAPTREFARAVLGTVSEVSAEQIEKSQGALKAGDMAGTSGLEAQYDSQLRGINGVSVVRQPAGKTAAELAALPQDPRVEVFANAPAPGVALKTTLDAKLQTLAENTLTSVGPASAIVALRPSTGDVLAAASGPGSNGYNTAMLGQYAPGSIFKTVDSLALLRKGKTPDSKVDCPATLTVDGRKFKNAEGYPSTSLGSVTLRDAFAHSCNTAFINARTDVDQAQLEAAAVSLGIAVEAPTLGADAFLGSVPGEAEGTEHAASMIGQGKILMSPLSAAMLAGAVAKGAPVQPRLVLNPDAASTSGNATASASASAENPSATASVSAQSPAATATNPVTKDEAAKLADMMRAVVTSGHAGFLAQVPGAPVGAKTGTAEFGTDNPPKTHAWIIATHGDLAVAVFVEDGGLGATTSGPLLQKFLTAAG
ncbi:penicillin-binding transpeptidase domain-containing protein [Pseudarthrobacter sp. J1738]|uniref:penicillin-binding transpeptidase domain-containing protein n=1 Tax=unclassified Pseudarthrobacter TaxID=2647000 RepID=UPI003D2CA6D7